MAFHHQKAYKWRRKNWGHVKKWPFWEHIIKILFVILLVSSLGLILFSLLISPFWNNSFPQSLASKWGLCKVQTLEEYYKILFSVAGVSGLGLNLMFLIRRIRQADELRRDQQWQAGFTLLGVDNQASQIAGLRVLDELAHAHPELYRKKAFESACDFLRTQGKEGEGISNSMQKAIDLFLKNREDNTNIYKGEEAQLRRAYLNKADLRNAQLQEAYLIGAQLQNADLFSAQLQGAHLRNAQLQGADLRNAQLQGADLRNAQLQGADLRNAQLQRAHLIDAQLQGAYLVSTELQETYLIEAQLQGADLRNAKLGPALKGAQLQGTCLMGTQIENTDLFRTHFGGAHVSLDLPSSIHTHCPKHLGYWRIKKHIKAPTVKEIKDLLKQVCPEQTYHTGAYTPKEAMGWLCEILKCPGWEKGLPDRQKWQERYEELNAKGAPDSEYEEAMNDLERNHSA